MAAGRGPALWDPAPPWGPKTATTGQRERLALQVRALGSGRLGPEGPHSHCPDRAQRVWTLPRSPWSCYITAPQGAGADLQALGAHLRPGRAAVGREARRRGRGVAYHLAGGSAGCPRGGRGRGRRRRLARCAVRGRLGRRGPRSCASLCLLPRPGRLPPPLQSAPERGSQEAQPSGRARRARRPSSCQADGEELTSRRLLPARRPPGRPGAL